MGNLNITLPDRAAPAVSTPRVNSDITPAASRYSSISFLAMRPHSRGPYFTRDSQATIAQPDGSLRVVRPNLIRYQPSSSGFIIEPAATNHFTQAYVVIDEAALPQGSSTAILYVITAASDYVTDSAGNYVTVSPAAPATQTITLPIGQYTLMVSGSPCTATIAFNTATGSFINNWDGAATDAYITPFLADSSLTDLDPVGGYGFVQFNIATPGSITVTISDYTGETPVWVQLVSGLNPHTIIPDSAATSPNTCASEHLILDLGLLAEIYRGA